MLNAKRVFNKTMLNASELKIAIVTSRFKQ